MEQAASGAQRSPLGPRAYCRAPEKTPLKEEERRAKEQAEREAREREDSLLLAALSFRSRPVQEKEREEAAEKDKAARTVIGDCGS